MEKRGTTVMHLSMKNIHKSFKARKVLQNISLDVKKGSFVSIVGPSGGGKSTLFNLIAGLLHPDEGDILLDGKVITNKSGHISYMPQNHTLLPRRTVLDNTLLAQYL